MHFITVLVITTFLRNMFVFKCSSVSCHAAH